MESREIEARVQEIVDLIDELSEELRREPRTTACVTLRVNPDKTIYIEPRRGEISFWLGEGL